MKRSLLGLLAAAALLIHLPGLADTPAAPAGPTKPNILVIMGGDIGWMNVSSYGGDIMGVTTPNIDRIGREGLRLGAFYAQPSCTAGRAAFITGQLPVRTGLTTVGTPGSSAGLKAEDITLAEILKTRGYATAQFGKNHLGDLDEHLPCRHGFDEFWGNLYHLNANEDLEDPDRPTNPEFLAKFNPRGIVSCTAGGAAARTSTARDSRSTMGTSDNCSPSWTRRGSRRTPSSSTPPTTGPISTCGPRAVPHPSVATRAPPGRVACACPS
jgi:arylsulfatase